MRVSKNGKRRSSTKSLTQSCPAENVFRRQDATGHFRFSSNHGNAQSPCFHAIPDAKPLHTFAGIALVPRKAQDPGIAEAAPGQLSDGAQ
jgi:hypothetical protein